MNRGLKLYKKLHNIPGVVVGVLLILFSVSGIVLNHRDLFSSVDIDRSYMPNQFQYSNWNNGGLKGSLILDDNRSLLYGAIGVWEYDEISKRFKDCNSGFLSGVDNRKVFDLHRGEGGEIYAATQSGVYSFNGQKEVWSRLEFDGGDERFVAIESYGDNTLLMSRSDIFSLSEDGAIERVTLAPPENYKKRVTLFKTIWQIHSGEIFGIFGKIVVDILGLVMILLSVTGVILFINPKLIKRFKRSGKSSRSIITQFKWSILWHNRLGRYTFILLILLSLTGIFLRPPLLIPIAGVEVRSIPYTHLDQDNPWYDRLRDLKYDKGMDRLILATSDGIYYLDNLDSKPQPFPYQPSVSVMGINVLEPKGDGSYIVGSFSGLFLWHPSYPEIFDFTTGALYKGVVSGRPVGKNMVSGLIRDRDNNLYMVDYGSGVKPLYHNKRFPSMRKEIIDNSPMGLWSLALEIHTGRIFGAILGDLYILIVPLSGLLATMVILSGYLLWRGRFKRR